MNTMIKLSTIGLLSLIAFTSAYAQVAQPLSPPTSTPLTCIALTHNLYFGAADLFTNGEVSQLQTFLRAEGYFPYQPVGIFGPITFGAVQRFQAANSIRSSGYAGPITRGAIQSLSCGSQPTPAPTPVQPANVSIQSISPISGPVGTTVSVTGYGFTAENRVLFGGGAIQNVPVSSSVGIACPLNLGCRGGIIQTLVFTVPSSIGPYCPPNAMCSMMQRLITPGDYTVVVQNSNGTSNTMIFTVTSGTPVPGQQPLSISGIDAPTQLSVGQTGTWTVHVSNTGNSTNVHYSVVWGDEYISPLMMSASGIPVLQSGATVTHAYTRAGTFTPIFTVTNDAGQSATISSTVVVN